MISPAIIALAVPVIKRLLKGGNATAIGAGVAYSGDTLMGLVIIPVLLTLGKGVRQYYKKNGQPVPWWAQIV